MSETMVEIERFSFAYPDGRQALTDVSFAIAEGERVALAGANGAGKSTLMLRLAGALHGGQGSVRMFGLPADGGKHLRQIRRQLGLVFQNPDDQLFCPTLFDDVAFGPRNLGLAEPEVAGRVEAALDAVGLAGFGRRSPFHLSLGEKKRAAIATVLAMRPRLLALDEPTSMLDGRGRREIVELLARLGGTQLIVTHDLTLIERLCGRMLVLSAGRLVADGPPAQVLADGPFLESHGLA